MLVHVGIGINGVVRGETHDPLSKELAEVQVVVNLHRQKGPSKKHGTNLALLGASLGSWWFPDFHFVEITGVEFTSIDEVLSTALGAAIQNVVHEAGSLSCQNR